MAAKKANKEQLKSEHEGKLIELYNTYYKKCLDGDTASWVQSAKKVLLPIVRIHRMLIESWNYWKTKLYLTKV